MVAELVLAVLYPFVGKLTEDFLNRRRKGVDIAEIQEQVVRLMASQRAVETELADARVTVLALTRHLVRTQGQTFVLHGDRLELLAGQEPGSGVGPVIERFSSSVEQRLHTRRAASGPPHVPARAPAAAPVSAADSAEALNSFFDGFEEEIMRARRGQER
ncbi:hypothetical protein [Sphaerisporangium sp. TRM90804]|uniref:hypothetical protein n=1 Tax=Sphaerisporangium sp. TRM90804 TaxID=3031113 RepID=UPI00244CFC31|nr:hypothetical protein [Sphaerisporangium sp. TRM90804]MDH2430412.1 hypothetical protein [Sphaerisporangium sp. TRM90804]